MTNPPAFPLVAEKIDNHPGWFSNEGMSLRDWFAGQALAGFCANSEWMQLQQGPASLAGQCYEMADALLLERSHVSKERL